MKSRLSQFPCPRLAPTTDWRAIETEMSTKVKRSYSVCPCLFFLFVLPYPYLFTSLYHPGRKSILSFSLSRSQNPSSITCLPPAHSLVSSSSPIHINCVIFYHSGMSFILFFFFYLAPNRKIRPLFPAFFLSIPIFFLPRIRPSVYFSFIHPITSRRHCLFIFLFHSLPSE